ncbi:TIGR02391 family protein [Patescibacteria group bacterium]
MVRKITKTRRTAKKGAAQQRKKPEAKKQRLSAADRQNIRGLADRLGKLIPLTGYRSSFTLTKLAKDRGLGRYLSAKTTNKKDGISQFLENLFVYRPRTTKTLIREILPRAIERRHESGDPILLDEATGLADQLEAIGIKMRKEIFDLQFPKDRPVIVPPPFEFQQMLKNFHLHPSLLPDCQKMFNDGHLNESVRKALEKFETAVQQICGLQEIGADLMGKAFNEKNPRIKLNALADRREINEQDGFKLMAMGMMRGWRNNLSHGSQAQMPPQEAFGRLVAISNMFHRLDGRQP